MKKKIIALIAVVVMLFSMAGCSKEGLSLVQEMNKVSAWDAEETSGTMTLSMNVPDAQIDMALDMKGWVNTKDSQGYVEVAFKELKVDGEVAEGITISPVKMYIDEQTIYFSKTYFTDIFALSETPVPEKFNEITTDYIGLDLSQGEEEVASIDEEKVTLLGEKILGDVKLDLPIKQEGREYTIALDSEQMIDGTIAFINAVMDNIEAINEFSDTGLTKEMVEEQRAELQPMLEEGKEMVKPMIDGSNVKLTYKFEDGKYKQVMEILFKLTIEGEVMEMKMAIDADSKKIAKKDFVLPESVTTVNMEEFLNMMMETGSSSQVAMTEVSKEATMVKDDVTYLPFRATMTELGYEVSYDKATQKTYVILEDEKVEATTLVQKGTAYISQEELLELGFQTYEDEEVFVVVR